MYKSPLNNGSLSFETIKELEHQLLMVRRVMEGKKGEEPTRQQYNSEFLGKQRQMVGTSGINLRYIPPSIVNGVTIIKIDAKEAKTMMNIWEKSIAVFVVVEKPSIESMRRYIKAGWWDIDKYKFF